MEQARDARGDTEVQTAERLAPGIRRVSEGPTHWANERGADPSAPLLTCSFPSLRGLDLNQRPLGYEFSVSRAPQAYPLVIGHLSCSEIT